MQQLLKMSVSDLGSVLETEVACYLDPWSQKIFEDCLSAASKGYCCMLAQIDGVTIGHAVFTVTLDEAELLNFCLAPLHQGRGLALEFLQNVIAYMRERGATRLFLEVRQSNAPARRLYASAGFVEVGVRKSYYPTSNGREDALLLSRDIPHRQR